MIKIGGSILNPIITILHYSYTYRILFSYGMEGGLRAAV